MFCARASVTVGLRWNYPDCLSDPGRGERFVDSHSRIVISRQRANESLIWSRIHSALRQHAEHVPRVPLGQGTFHAAHSHPTPTHLRQQEVQNTETAILWNLNVWVMESGLPGPSSPYHNDPRSPPCVRATAHMRSSARISTSRARSSRLCISFRARHTHA